MSSILFLKRIFSDKIYWMSVMAALLLLLCSIVYTDNLTGQTYTFITLFYDETAKEALQYGGISMQNILLGYDNGYLWMFCPIIAGIPCVITRKTERLVMFRMGRNKYVFSKYFSNIAAGGAILCIAYFLYMSAAMAVLGGNIWDMNLVKKLMSVFSWGVMNAVPGIILSEFIENKYLILCIPFVFNYFICIFIVKIIPYDVWKYISPYNYQILFLNSRKMIITGMIFLIGMLAVGAVIRKIIFERRCDCGQR